MKKTNHMHLVHPQPGKYANDRQVNLKLIEEENYHYRRFLPGLLKDYYIFRMYATILTGHLSPNGLPLYHKSWFFGFENKCTYLSCLRGHVSDITLDRVYGYNGLLKMMDPGGSLFGKTLKAVLYGRDDAGDFSIVHRYWHEGKLDEGTINDPVINGEDQFLHLPFTIQKNRVIIMA